MLFRSVLLVSFVCSFCVPASKTKTSQKCITSLSTLSARVSHVSWAVLSNAENYSSTPTICDFSEAMFEDCCAIRPIQFESTSNPPELEQLRIQWLGPVATALLNHSLYLQRYFIECLNLTMAALDVSFQSSYGYNYQNNKEFFVHFFGDLESYMLGHRQNLSQMVDNFFDELLKRIVRLLWFAKSQDDLVIADCISAELQQHSPFGRIPEGIKRMAIRAFPPARMTANALLIGSETISNALNEVNLVYSCHINWMKLRYCKFCFGEPLASICPDDCQQQIALCMNDYYSLDDPWTHFIDNLLELVNRLRGSDSFPQVNRPLQIHITDAIMSFQRLFSRIDPTLLKKCGYSRRNANTTRSRQTRHIYSVERDIFSSVPETVDYFRVLPSLENQTKLMRDEYLSVRSLFSNLERSFCSPQLLHYPNHSGKSVYACWNGNRMSSTRLTSNRSKPHPRKPDPVIRRLSTRLQAITHLLQTVLNDNADPDFVPLEDSRFINRLRSFWHRESEKRLSNPTTTSLSLDANAPNEYVSGNPYIQHNSDSTQTSLTDPAVRGSEGSGYSWRNVDPLHSSPENFPANYRSSSIRGMTSYSVDDEDYSAAYPDPGSQYLGTPSPQDRRGTIPSIGPHYNPVYKKEHEDMLATTALRSALSHSVRASTQSVLRSLRPTYHNVPSQLWIPQHHPRYIKQKWIIQTPDVSSNRCDKLTAFPVDPANVLVTLLITVSLFNLCIP